MAKRISAQLFVSSTRMVSSFWF